MLIFFRPLFWLFAAAVSVFGAMGGNVPLGINDGPEGVDPLGNEYQRRPHR